MTVAAGLESRVRFLRDLCFFECKFQDFSIFLPLALPILIYFAAAVMCNILTQDAHNSGTRALNRRRQWQLVELLQECQ